MLVKHSYSFHIFLVIVNYGIFCSWRSHHLNLYLVTKYLHVVRTT